METTPEAFWDFEIRIAPKGTGVYRVTIKLGEGGECSGDFSTQGLPLWGSGGDPVQYGKDLFTALFADPDLHDMWVAARARHEQRRIRLWIEPGAAELHSLPWELLRDGDVWLATDDKTPFSRHLPLSLPRPDLLPAHPIRVLVVVSNPDDLQDKLGLMQIDVAKEHALVQEAFVDFLPPKKKGGMRFVEVTPLPAPVTLDRLNEALGEGDGYHVLHFVGHGSVSQKSRQAALYLQGAKGKVKRVNDKEFATLIQRQGEKRPRLVFLAACHSATRATLDAFAGLGPRLIEAGVPAVVAMQDFVDIDTARRMTPIFYKKLMLDGAVDRALNAARRTLDAAWCSDAYVPTLFMRREDGQLWLHVNESGRVQAADIELPKFWPSIRIQLAAWRDDPSRSTVFREIAGVLLDRLADNPTLAQVRRDLPWMLLFGDLMFRLGEKAGEKSASTAIKVDRFIDMLRRPREELTSPTVVQPSGGKVPEETAGKVQPEPREEPRRSVEPRLGWEPELVFVPKGKFLMGTTAQQAALRQKFGEYRWYKFDWETPQHTLYLPDYYIGKYPVTNAQYQVFVQETGHDSTPWYWKNKQFPSGQDNHPVRGLYWKEAVVYCKWLTEKIQDAGCKIKVWRGGILVTEELPRASCIVRLPTEAEWEKAARGTDGRTWPWGDDPPTERLCNFGDNVKGTTPVGRYSPQGDSPYGCADMAGNVWEWTSTRWGPKWEEPQFTYPYRPDDGREDMRSDDRRVARGGGYWNSQEYLRCACRDHRGWFIDNNVTGLRVCVAAPFSHTFAL